MINLKSIRQIFDGCGFVHRLISQSSGAKQQKSTPRETSIEKVFQCIKMHKVITKKVIMDKIGISGPCLESCFEILLSRKKIQRGFIRFSGPYKVYRYSEATK